MKIGFSVSEVSNQPEAPRIGSPLRQTQTDTFLDVTEEVEPAVVPLQSSWPPPFPRRDQLSLLAVTLILCAGFLIGELFERSSPLPPAQLPVYQVNLNSADLEELVLLEGIGELTAEKILQDRAENGPFRDTEDLQRVNGIGPKTLDRLRDQVVCR